MAISIKFVMLLVDSNLYSDDIPMRFKTCTRASVKQVGIVLAILLMLIAAAPSVTQGDSQPTINPMRSAMQVARELIEEDLGAPMRLKRWLFYEDNWSSRESASLYGFFGIDSCAGSIAPDDKRDHVIFGWTFTFNTTTGESYQARVSFDLQDSVICDEVLIPPQYAPQPTPIPPPAAEPATEAAVEAAVVQAAPVVLGPPSAGLAGFALGGHVAGLDGTAITKMKSSGMTWVKKQVRHGISDGGDVIAQAHANGFKILLGALGSKAQLQSNFDGYVAQFAEYVAHLARLGADAIEVWNEPNIEREWPIGQVNGNSYTRLLQAAYHAIKAANPGTLVISGAPAPTGYFSGGCAAEGCNDDVFLAQMAQAGAANYMDCVGIHYNSGTSPPTSTSGANVQGWHYSWYLPSMMNVYRSAFPGRPLCFTELGYLTGEGLGDLPGGFAWASVNTLAEQAAWLAGAANMARASGYVSMMIVWNVNFTAWGSDPQAGYAIIRPGGGCPACASLARAMAF